MITHLLESGLGTRQTRLMTRLVRYGRLQLISYTVHHQQIQVQVRYFTGMV